MNSNKPQKIKERRDINIGIVVFIFVLLYLAICVYRYFTKSELAIYEVPVGTLYSTESFVGMIIREEEIVTSEDIGYVNYYYNEGDRVSKNETIYSLDSEKNVYEKLGADSSEIKLQDDDIYVLKKMINKKYAKLTNFADFDGVKEELSSTYIRELDKILLKNLNDILAQKGINADVKIAKAPKAGIISYYVDDYTNIKENGIRSDMFDTHKECEYIYTSSMLTANTPVYKMITNDDWKIVVKINQEVFSRIYNKEFITFTINSKQTITAPVSVNIINDDYFLCVELTKYITNYTKYRFLDISFDTENAEGLKLPETSICYKDYYRIPRIFLLSDKEKEINDGLLIEIFDQNAGSIIPKLTAIDIFYADTDFIYIDSKSFDPNIYISTRDGLNRAMLYTFTVKLEGAYNINNGYSEFRRIESIASDGSYRLVKKNTVSGLSAYDHIALNSSDISEGSVIIK